MRAIADNPSEIDLLNYDDYAFALVDLIKSETTQKPLTIGIDAPWGMGKTTLMKMIQRELEPDFPTIWFNAWKHDNEESLWSAFILEILSQIKQKYSWGKRILFGISITWKRINFQKIVDSLTKVFLTISPPLIIISLIIIIGLNIFWPEVTRQDLLEKVYEYSRGLGILGLFTLIYKLIETFYNFSFR